MAPVVVHSPDTRVSFFGIERLHPFDTGRMDKIAQILAGQGLVREFVAPAPITEEDLAAVHDPTYLTSLHELPILSQALLERSLPSIFPRATLERLRRPFRTAVAGSLCAARGALSSGLGINLGGGFHHARPAMGHGFCLYNDVAYTLHMLRTEGYTGQVLIIDTDAHQGDGNHAFFASDPSVYTLSIHQGSLFPFPKLPGDLDIELPAGTGDRAYLEALDLALDRVLSSLHPAFIVHVAGADVLVDDPLTGLLLTPDGLAERDRRVHLAARTRDIPLLYLLAGGYGPSAAAAQAHSIAAALRFYR